MLWLSCGGEDGRAPPPRRHPPSSPPPPPRWPCASATCAALGRPGSRCRAAPPSVLGGGGLRRVDALTSFQ
eukprot:scaffold79101_cov65-Phaeocystis_antarctica.AAC.7